MADQSLAARLASMRNMPSYSFALSISFSLFFGSRLRGIVEKGRALDPLANPNIQALGSARHRLIEDRPFLGRHRIQDELRRVLALPAADSDLQTCEFLALEDLQDGGHAPMPPARARTAVAEPTQRQVKVIVDHQQVGGPSSEVAQDVPHRPPAEVH